MKFFLLVAFFSTLLISSCKETTSVEPTYQAPDSSYGLIYNKIFTPTCALSGCHANESHASHAHAVTLAGSATYEGLINVVPKNGQAIVAGLKLIVPSDSTKSFLYQKLIYSRSAHKYGSPMPTGGLVLRDKQILFVRKWIEAGAPKEGHVADKTLMN